MRIAWKILRWWSIKQWTTRLQEVFINCLFLIRFSYIYYSDVYCIFPLLYTYICFLQEGRLPNLRAFIEASLEHNKALCGNNTSLKPCPIRKENVHGFVFLVVMSICGTLFLLFIIAVVLFVLQKIRRNRDEPRETQARFFFTALSHDGKKVYEEIVEATENFDSKYCIGVGGYGSVYKTLLSTGQVVAVKKPHENGGPASHEAFANETSVLTRIRHRNIIKLHGFCSHTRHSFLVYEFMERGSLLKILSDEVKALEFEWTKRMNVLKGLANAISYLHHECRPAIVHRDISSKNVLLDAEYEAHISDFGSARTCDPESSNWTSFAGTFGYSAPGKRTRSFCTYNVYLILVRKKKL